MTTITCSAPGNVVLMGEYAILKGYPAIVASVDTRLHVSITPIDKPILDIDSDMFGSCEIALNRLSAPPVYQYVLWSFRQFLPHYQNQGFRIRITSNLPSNKGLGSSAAVSAALCGAFYYYQHQKFDRDEIFKLARKAVLEAQLVGSGADVAASVYGGVLYYIPDDEIRSEAHIQPIEQDLPLFAVYCGYKTSTPIAIRRCMIHGNIYSSIYAKIDSLMGDLTEALLIAIQNRHLKRIGDLFRLGHGILWTYGVSTKELDDIVHKLQKVKSVYGEKISGAGLGDCVIGLGTVTAEDVAPYELIPVPVASEGVRLESAVAWGVSLMA